MTPPLAKKKFDATIKGECSECCYGLLVDSPHLLCFVTRVVFWTLSVTWPRVW